MIGSHNCFTFVIINSDIKYDTMLNSKKFAKRLGKILDFYGLTASALAEEIDFNRSTISHLISGRNKPSLEFVLKLLQKFPELEFDWLVLGKGTFPTDSLEQNRIEPETKSAPTPSPNLFSEKQKMDKTVSAINSAQGKIARIAIFFTDGSFEVYEN